ncbi:MAG: glycosyltransferase family 2 protein [bacterium]|nr:glycosyltransferase family 2 protein [bacterium]
MTSISVFFPCYNDAKTIAKLIATARKQLKKITRKWEIIVIDDGSTDDSRKVLTKLSKKNKDLKVVFHPKNRGYGGVLQTGFKTSKNDLVFYTDGDGQYDVGELPILFHLMSADISFVNGIKMSRQDYSYRVIIGNLYAFTMRWMFLLKVHDVDCDFRLIRKSIVKQVHLTCNSGAVCVELVKKAQLAGAKFRHVGVHHYERGHGHSQFFRLDRIVHTAAELVVLWINIMLSKKWNAKNT